MPMVRYQIRDEYGLSDPELYAAPEKDDPEALLEAVAMAGLVGLLRQLGDLAEFAAEIFHDLHEEVMATASRGHGLTLRLHQLETEFPSVEKALISQISLPNVTQTEEIQWHTNVRIDQNLITRGDMPRFVMDSYEECRGPPRLFTLDKFDVAGAGACLKRYSDPSFFKTELASSYSIETEDAPRERKPRKIKKKTTRWKKGETLESLLISTSESPPSSENQSSGKGHTSRVVKLKPRRLQTSDNNARKMCHSHLLELIQSQQKIILEDSEMQSTTKPASNGISKEASAPVLFQTESEAQKMHKVYPIQEQSEASSESEKVGIETYSSRQTREKAMTDSDDMASENENFLDALNTIELETETDNENKSRSDPVNSSQEQMVHVHNFGADSVQELVATEKGLKLNEEIEYGEATEEFFDNDDLMDVSSTSSLHSDGIQPTEQFFMSRGNNIMAVSKLPADESGNVPSAPEKINTVNEAQLGFEDLKCSTTQTDDHQENMDTPITDGSPETSGASDVILNLQENKLHDEIPTSENSLGSEERREYVINNKSSAGLEEAEEPLDNPVEVPQIELRNISDEILNLEEYLISTRKEESVSQDIVYHGDKDAHNYDITAEPFNVHTEETTQNFVEDRSEDPNESVQHEDDNILEDALNGECSLYSNKEDGISPRSTASVPIRDDTDLSTRTTGFDLVEALYEIRIQHNNDPTASTSDDYIENGQSTSNPVLVASSSEPHSPINIFEENTIQGYPKYHMDNFVEPDEGLLDLDETKEETHRNKSLHHCEIETQSEQLYESEDFLQYLDKGESTVLLINQERTVDSLHHLEVETPSEQLNESEDLPQYLVKDESTVLPISHEPAVESLQDNSEKNSASSLHKLSVDGDDSLGLCAENPFCRNTDVLADGVHTNKLEPFSQNEKSKMLEECVVAGEKEGGLHPADYLWEPTGLPCERMFESDLVTKSPTITSVDKKDALLQPDVVLGSADNILHYDEVGDHQVSEHEAELELSDICDDNKVDGQCEKTLSVEDGFTHVNQEDTSIEVNEPLKEGKINDEVLIENSNFEERANSLDSAPIPFTVKDEVLVEAYKHNCAEGTLPTSPVVATEVFVTISELSEEGDSKGCGLTPVAVNNEALVESLKSNEIDSAEGDEAASHLRNIEALAETEETNEEVNGEGDVSTSPVVNSETLVKTIETKEEVNSECGILNPFVLKVHVEGLKTDEIGGAEGGVSVNNEVLVENSESEEEGDAGEGGPPLPLEVKSQVFVEALKINEKCSAESDVACVDKLELNEEDNCDFGVSIPSVNHDDKLLQNEECKTEKEMSVEFSNAEEESTRTGSPTPSVDLVREILQEPTNLSCHEPDTPSSSKDHEYHQESASYADLVLTTEERNISQSCTISLDNPLYDASFSDNLSEECSEPHSNKPEPFTNLQNDQEKLQEDINQIATDILHNGSNGEPWTVDPNESAIAGPPLNSSLINKDNKGAQEGLNLEPGNTLSGSKSIDEVLANSDLANVTVETKENDLDMCSAYSLPSEHKPPPLPPLGWRMGGKLSKGTLLPANSHASKPVDETNQNISLQTRSMEAPSIANRDDFGRIEGEKPRIMSLSDLPPLSYQHELANPNLASVPISGVNVQSMEYNNGLSTALAVTGPEVRVPQYLWPDAQHAFLPVQAWNTGPSLVQGHQPGYLISLEDNLWAQYGVGPPFEDERLGRKHHSIRDMPRNPLMDAVAAHDRTTMRKVSELVKPDDKSKADERNSLLEQIRNKSFSLKPVGAPKTTSVKAPQTNLKVAAIVEKANAIRQAFVGSDEEDEDNWSDA